MTDIRACLTCEHFRIDLGEPGYSEYTPATGGEVTCKRSGDAGCAWTNAVDDDPSPRAFRSIAEDCDLYQIHHDLTGA